MSESRETVHCGYGQVMEVVQWWERIQNVIWFQVKRKHPNRPAGDWDTERSQREIKRLQRAFLQLTPQNVIDQIEPSLPTGAANEVRALFPVRNRLAHRFLLESLDGDTYKDGTDAELRAMWERFKVSLDVLATTEALHAQPYEGDVPPHWQGIAERITDRLFSGEAIPDDPNQQ